MKREIDKLLREEHDPETRSILKRLKHLNKRAYRHMMQPYKSYPQKYKTLQNTPVWSEAKELLKKYKDDLRCAMCKSNATNDFVLHHTTYELTDIFTPSFVQFVHQGCHYHYHKRHDKRGWEEK